MSCCSESFPRKLGDKKQTQKGKPGVGNWDKHIALKEYMDGIRKAKPLTEYQWWALRAIQSTVLSNPWRGWSLWGGNSRTPEKTVKTVGNSLTPSPRWCWARSSVDTRQKTKCARPSPKNHSLHFADGKAGDWKTINITIREKDLVESDPYWLCIFCKFHLRSIVVNGKADNSHCHCQFHLRSIIVNGKADHSRQICVRVIFEGWKQEIVPVVEFKSRSHSAGNESGLFIDCAWNAYWTLLLAMLCRIITNLIKALH